MSTQDPIEVLRAAWPFPLIDLTRVDGSWSARRLADRATGRYESADTAGELVECLRAVGALPGAPAALAGRIYQDPAAGPGDEDPVEVMRAAWPEQLASLRFAPGCVCPWIAQGSTGEGDERRASSPTAHELLARLRATRVL